MGKQIQKGSSLVEVMVALFVLAIGLLGVLAMQAKSMQYNQSAHIYAQSIYLANDMAERIKSNPSQANSYLTASIPATAPTSCEISDFTSTGCTQAQLNQWDLYNWKTRVVDRLPDGKAEISTLTESSRNYLNIVVSFDESRVDGREPDANYSGRKEYSLLVEI